MGIQASRIATYLHCISVPGITSQHIKTCCPHPGMTFCSSGQRPVKRRVFDNLWAYLQVINHKPKSGNGIIKDANCVSLCSAVNSRSARVLLLLVVPGHLLFLYTVQLLQGGHTAMTYAFVCCYLCAALLQVWGHWSTNTHTLKKKTHSTEATL